MPEEIEKFSTPLEIDIDKMNEHVRVMVNEIDAEIKAIAERQRKLSIAKQSLQEVCYHQFEPAGQTHGGQFEKCRFCGKTQRN